MAIDLSEFGDLAAADDFDSTPFADYVASLDPFEFGRDLAAAREWGEKQMLLHDRFAAYPHEFSRSRYPLEQANAPQAYWGAGTDRRSGAYRAWRVVTVNPALYAHWSLPKLPDVEGSIDEFSGTLVDLSGAGKLRTPEWNLTLFARLRTDSEEFVRVSMMDDRWQWNQAYLVDVGDALGGRQGFADFLRSVR